MIIDDIIYLSGSLGYALVLTLVFNKTCHLKFHFKQKKKFLKFQTRKLLQRLIKIHLGQAQ